MDTNLYRYMVEVAACGSISGAARKLFISQPALTKQIGRLEAQLGVKLFDRGRSRIALTHAGEVFVEFAMRYVEQEQEMLEELGRVEGTGLEKVLVAMTHRGGAYVGTHTPAFLEAHPGISLEYVDMSASDCETALENGTAEMAVYTDPVISEDIEYMPLEEDPMVLAVPLNSPLLKDKDVSRASFWSPLELDSQELRNPSLTWVLSTQRHSLYYAEQMLFRRLRIKPTHVLKIDYVETRYTVACNGGGVALFPKVTIRNKEASPNVVCCTIRGERLYRYVVIARKRGQVLTPGADSFWRYMVNRGRSI